MREKIIDINIEGTYQQDKSQGRYNYQTYWIFSKFNGKPLIRVCKINKIITSVENSKLHLQAVKVAFPTESCKL